MADPIKFNFDFTSAYSYPAACKIDSVAGRHGREVDWRPISLGHMFKATGAGFLTVPTKLKYAARDAARLCAYLGVRQTMPKVFPMDGKLARRVFWHTKTSDADLARRFALAVFDAYWGDGNDMSKAEQLASIAGPLGITADDIAAAGDDAEAKAAEQAAFDEALEAGMFGAPTMFVDDEMFWGADRLDQLDWWLGEKAAGMGGI